LPLTQGEPDYALRLAERDDQEAVYALWWDQPPLRVASGLAEWVSKNLEVAQLDLLLSALEDRGVPRSALHPEPLGLSAASREPERHWITTFGLEPGDEL